jgi:hypothetical protein
MKTDAMPSKELNEYLDRTGAEEVARRCFLCLEYQQQLQAVRRLVAVGYTERLIAAATGWSVEMVRHVLGEGSSGS